MNLNELKDRPGAARSRKRIGRGTGSGRGSTSGRGHKGQKSRSGVAIKGFEGGQMPLARRLPKRGFSNPNGKRFNVVNLGRVQQAIDAKKLDPKKNIDIDALIAAGVVTARRDGVRLLAKGEIKAKANFEVDGVSKAAAAAVEKAGGKVSVRGAEPAKQAKETKPAKGAEKAAKEDEAKPEEKE